MKNRNRRKLAYEVSALTGFNREKSSEIIQIILSTIASALRSGEPVSISGFGRFHKVNIKPHTKAYPLQHQPKGAVLRVNPTSRVYFRPSNELKWLVECCPIGPTKVT